MGIDDVTIVKLEASARDCIRAALAIDSLRCLYDQDDPYRPCINASLSPLLHLLANLFQSCGLAQRCDQPWLDFGDEPTTEREGELKLGRFLQETVLMLDGPRPAPFTCAEVRATTFAIMLDTTDTAT
jgi:hypothetical protein